MSVKSSPTGVTGEVGTSIDYMIFQHGGTGLHGPRRKRITSKSGGPLVFTSRGPWSPSRQEPAGKPVFTQSTQGVRPIKYLIQGLEAAVPFPVVKFHIYPG